MSNKTEGGRPSRSQGGVTFRRVRLAGWVSLAAVVSLTAAACGSSSPSKTTSSGSNTIPSGLSISSFTVNIAQTMSKFKPLTAFATKGANTLQVGVILPDTTSSTRYVNFDQPYLNAAFADAGYTQAQYRIDNAQGSDATELDDATADINLGAKILIMDPLDGPTGVAIAKLAASKGVTLISYDRATFQGSKTYYVSFNNEQVGELIGQGFQSCVSSWKISKPQVYVLNGGEDTDPNAISFATGYNKVVWGQAAKTVSAGATNSQGMKLVGENFAPGWDNTKGQTIFQQAFTANPKINATIEANDGLANSVITDLKAAGVKPNKIPTTGQDATAQGMAWILEGYQCGSVYKAVYKEAQDAVSLATILLAGDKPPAGLLNGSTTDPADQTIKEPASLLTPVWVTKANMETTVVKDGFDPASAICAIAGASVCASAGIQ
ncbi:MAG TPA: substrate-binding domain-containing protein [Streptosporangiaceae bacterium]|jgi:D-xylose transport system substrate-binding protein|nr:substrate-binding domain-containing protein [Streptosporangiaceae bacterium]